MSRFLASRIARIEAKRKANEPPMREIGVFAGKPIWKTEERDGVIRFDSGFGAYFFATPIEKTDGVVRSAVNRAKAAVQNGIATLERIANDTTVTEDVRNENGKLLFQNINKEVSRSISEIRAYSEREANAARDRAFAVIGKRSDRSDTYAEIRQIIREKQAKNDPAWPAELNQLVKADVNVAAAINAASPFASGLSKERHSDLVMTAVVEHAGADAEAMTDHVKIGKEADRMAKGLARLGQAFYNAAQADRAAATRTDPNASLVPPDFE